MIELRLNTVVTRGKEGDTNRQYSKTKRDLRDSQGEE